MERDAALAALVGALDSAGSARGPLIVVEGAAGAGKSRLLAECARMAAERELPVHSARGTVLERGIPFGVMRRLLDRPLAELGEAERQSLVESPAAPALDLVDGAIRAAPPADMSLALANSFFRLYSRLAELGAIVVVVDDLHWADRSSAQALAYLAGRLEDLPLALVVAVRTGEPVAGPDPRAALGESSAAMSIVAGPLSRRGSARFLESLLGEVAGEFVDAAYDATAGNPFLLREIAFTVARERYEPDAAAARDLAGIVPATVTGWASRRVESLPTAAQRLARSLAVLEQAEIGVAGAHAELAPDEARAAADRLADAGLVERELPLRFAHPLVRAALYERLPPAARDDAHHQAALLLQDRGAPAERVGMHLLQCEPRGERWAIDTLRSAAGEALARGAAEEAAHALTRAAAEPGVGDDPAVLAELGRARAAVNDPRAIADLERAAARADDEGTRVGALAALAQAKYLAGDIRGAFEAAGRALDGLPAGIGGTAEAELLLGYLMAGRQSPALLAQTRAALGTSRATETGAATPAEVVRRQVIALDAFISGDRVQAAEHAHWVAAQLAEQPRDEELPSLLAIGPAFVLTGLGDWEAADKVISRALARAGHRGSPLEMAECLHERVWQRWRRGDVEGGLADIQTVLDLTEGAWDPAKVPMRVAQAHLLLERDEIDAAAQALDLPPEVERGVPGTWGWPWLAIGRAVLAMARGDPQTALADALSAGRRLAEIDALSPEYAPWRSLAATAAAGAGKVKRATSLAREELELGEAIGAPRARGTALLALAAIADRAERIALLRRAVAELDGARADLLRGRARLALGMQLRRARASREARGPLREALDLGRATGASALAERALAELQAAGGRPRRMRSTGVDALTPREHEIAMLAADGLGNVEIAERLFITRKTVEGHLRAIFRKLEISSREQIRGPLGR